MSFLVQSSGVLTTVQDAGRPGYAHLGVSHSGAADRPAYELANRLVGNPSGAATLESAARGPVLRSDEPGVRWIAVTGAPCAVQVGGRPAAFAAPVAVRPGELIEVGTAVRGLRSYLAVGGGFDAEVVLGSRSTDTLGGLGPSPLRAGDQIPLGLPTVPSAVDVGPQADPGSVLRVLPGPGGERFEASAWSRLLDSRWTVQPASDRIGLRLSGPALPAGQPGPSEGIVLGSVQVPPDGQPVIFLADHPTTGGYPVIAVLRSVSLVAAAQVRPGDRVSLRVG